jgi:hypothetical protein
MVGAPGTATATTVLEQSKAVPLPTRLVAVTLKVSLSALGGSGVLLHAGGTIWHKAPRHPRRSGPALRTQSWRARWPENGSNFVALTCAFTLYGRRSLWEGLPGPIGPPFLHCSQDIFKLFSLVRGLVCSSYLAHALRWGARV